MIDPVVREATADDRDALVALAAEARTMLADVRGGARWIETHPNPFTADPSLDDVAAVNDASNPPTTIIATLDEVPVGYLVADVNSSIATIAEVYVTPAARELGFGDTLLATAVRIARERGCGFLEADALPGDRQTKNLYERAGIKARLIVVSTVL